MSKEIIELLEKANIRERADDIWAFQKEGNLSYDQREEIKRYSCLLHDAAKIITQVLVKLREKQPQAGEPINLERQNEILFEANRNIKDRLDTSEAKVKGLLEACEGLMEKADNGSADFDDPAPGSIYLKAIAAIAKAKEE